MVNLNGTDLGKLNELTRIDDFGDWTAKRDDLACYTTPDMPSGSKVRQYAAMAAAHPGLPMLVGCSAASAMQIYVAAAAKQAGVKAVVVTAGRGVRTDATAYAKRMGAKVIEVYPGGYLNVLQAKAKAYAAKHFKDGYVKWSEEWAIKDAMQQTRNIPGDAKRIVVPVGSGLVLAGILAGLARQTLSIPVLAVAVSPMAQTDHVKALAKQILVPDPTRTHKLPKLRIVRAESKYDQWVAAVLPDGSALDPFYAAKALKYVKAGDCFWVPGVRPVCSMPVKCQDVIYGMREYVEP